MAASAEEIARLRRMVAEPSTETYSDATLQAYIERYPLPDVNGEYQYLDVYIGPNGPTQITNPLWVATYDLNSAAADVWDEKASALVGRTDYSADGLRINAAQLYDHAVARGKYYRSRKAAKTFTVRVSPRVTTTLDALDRDDTN